MNFEDKSTMTKLREAIAALDGKTFTAYDMKHLGEAYGSCLFKMKRKGDLMCIGHQPAKKEGCKGKPIYKASSLFSPVTRQTKQKLIKTKNGKVWTEEEKQTVIKLNEDRTVEEIVKITGLSQSAIYRVLHLKTEEFKDKSKFFDMPYQDRDKEMLDFFNKLNKTCPATMYKNCEKLTIGAR